MSVQSLVTNYDRLYIDKASEFNNNIEIKKKKKKKKKKNNNNNNNNNIRSDLDSLPSTNTKRVQLPST